MKKPSEIDVEELVRAVYFYFYELTVDGHTDWLDIHEGHIADELGIGFGDIEWIRDWAGAKPAFDKEYWITEDEFNMEQEFVLT